MKVQGEGYAMLPDAPGSSSATRNKEPALKQVAELIPASPGRR